MVKSVSSVAKPRDGEGGGERCEQVSGVWRRHVSGGALLVRYWMYSPSTQNLSVSGPALGELALRTCM